MDIAENDILLYNIKKRTNDANNQIINKAIQLKNQKNQNRFLNLIYQDYLNHYDYMLNQKIKTRNALLNVYKHLENIENNNNFTNTQLVHAKNEQNNVLNKLYNIKKEIDSLTNLN
tara:strand:+ start:156 stop:503 length:348 start_codon:yes stop_codon:yes gene_type:complete